MDAPPTMQASVAVVALRRDRRGRRWIDAPPTWRRPKRDRRRPWPTAPRGRAASPPSPPGVMSHRGRASSCKRAALLRVMEAAPPSPTSLSPCRLPVLPCRARDARSTRQSYGFSAQQREGPLAALVRALERVGAEVWEPFARTGALDRGRTDWAYRVGQADLRDVREADGIFAVVNGCPPDEGVMVELGWPSPGASRPSCSATTSAARRTATATAEPDALHRPPRRGVGGLLVRVGRRDSRPRQGPRALARGAPLPPAPR